MTVEQRVARRVLAAQDPKRVLREIQSELRKMKGWAKGFRSTLRDSQRNSNDAPRGYVWQEDWARFWEPFDPIQRKLYNLETEVDHIDEDLGLRIDPYIEPPRAARIEEAIGDPQFLQRGGEDHIAYSEKALKDWYNAFSWWVDYASKGIQEALREI
jgi:hypothetical protein